ncbi:MAG: hypothetical protein OHK0017_05770 [Patescibacteria group bacterium]
MSSEIKSGNNEQTQFNLIEFLSKKKGLLIGLGALLVGMGGKAYIENNIANDQVLQTYLNRQNRPQIEALKTVQMVSESDQAGRYNYADNHYFTVPTPAEISALRARLIQRYASEGYNDSNFFSDKILYDYTYLTIIQLLANQEGKINSEYIVSVNSIDPATHVQKTEYRLDFLKFAEEKVIPDLISALKRHNGAVPIDAVAMLMSINSRNAIMETFSEYNSTEIELYNTQVKALALCGHLERNYSHIPFLNDACTRLKELATAVRNNPTAPTENAEDQPKEQSEIIANLRKYTNLIISGLRYAISSGSPDAQAKFRDSLRLESNYMGSQNVSPDTASRLLLPTGTFQDEKVHVLLSAISANPENYNQELVSLSTEFINQRNLADNLKQQLTQEIDQLLRRNPDLNKDLYTGSAVDWNQIGLPINSSSSREGVRQMLDFSHRLYLYTSTLTSNPAQTYRQAINIYQKALQASFDLANTQNDFNTIDKLNLTFALDQWDNPDYWRFIETRLPNNEKQELQQILDLIKTINQMSEEMEVTNMKALSALADPEIEYDSEFNANLTVDLAALYHSQIIEVFPELNMRNERDRAFASILVPFIKEIPTPLHQTRFNQLAFGRGVQDFKPASNGNVDILKDLRSTLELVARMNSLPPTEAFTPENFNRASNLAEAYRFEGVSPSDGVSSLVFSDNMEFIASAMRDLRYNINEAKPSSNSDTEPNSEEVSPELQVVIDHLNKMNNIEEIRQFSNSEDYRLSFRYNESRSGFIIDIDIEAGSENSPIKGNLIEVENIGQNSYLIFTNPINNQQLKIVLPQQDLKLFGELNLSYRGIYTSNPVNLNDSDTLVQTIQEVIDKIDLRYDTLFKGRDENIQQVISSIFSNDSIMLTSTMAYYSTFSHDDQSGELIMKISIPGSETITFTRDQLIRDAGIKYMQGINHEQIDFPKLNENELNRMVFLKLGRMFALPTGDFPKIGN